MDRYSIDKRVLNTISEMDSGEQMHLDTYLGDVVLEITKDPNFTEFKDVIMMDMCGKDAFNLVTVDFKLNGKSIATTDDIHVSELEDALNNIREGDTTLLIDEDKPLADIVKAANKRVKSAERE